MLSPIFLIDGSNQAYRAYHSMQADLRSPDGFPTRALYGFSRILVSLVKRFQPSHVLVVFDKGKSFRCDLLPDYKGHRPEMPEDLRLQWPELAPMCNAFGFSTFAEANGYEADDTIGTLSVQFSNQGRQVYIVSNDKDFAQLVNNNISLYNPIKDEIMGIPEVVDKWGVPPERISDLLALVGDKSDNVPGIPGVGVKKAATFINKYGGWQAVLSNADDIGGKTGQKVADSVEIVELAATLVKICTTVPLSIELNDIVIRDPDADVLYEKLQHFGFHRFIKELDLKTPKANTIESKYRIIDNPIDLQEYLSQRPSNGVLSVDLETTGLDALTAKIVGVSLCYDPIEAIYIPINHKQGDNYPDAMTLLDPVFQDHQIPKIGQNLKYDLKVLIQNGFNLVGIASDTMLADYLLHPNQKHDLDTIALRELNYEMSSYSEVTKDYDGQFANVPIEEACQYAAEDAHIVYLIHQKQDLSNIQTVHDQIEIPLIRILAEMELLGIHVLSDELSILSTKLSKRIEELKSLIYADAGIEFNLNSTQQLAKVLYEDKGMTPIKKTKTGYSTNSQTLKLLLNSTGEPIIGWMLEYRECAKLKSTYVDALPNYVSQNGKIHTSLHQAVAATGRLASSNPNLQNIPIKSTMGKAIRRCFVPSKGNVLISCDYSQIELRVLAHYCGKGKLLEAFNNNVDIHEMTGIEIAGGKIFYRPEHRAAAKAINYGLVYGMSSFRLSRELDISIGQAKRYMDTYFNRYPEVKGYMESAISDAKEAGYSSTVMGRKRPIFGLKSGNKNERESAERMSMNSPIQGSAADLIKLAMIRVHKRLINDFPKAKLLLQIHDELLVESPLDISEDVKNMMISEMETCDFLNVPIKVNYAMGYSWDEVH